MPSENLKVSTALSVFAWVILIGGVSGVAVSLLYLPIFSWQTVLPSVLALIGVIAVFALLTVLSRVLRTLTYLYQLAWEQFEQIGNDIDELDGRNDGNLAPQCPYCGAMISPEDSVCSRCGKELPSPDDQKA